MQRKNPRACPARGRRCVFGIHAVAILKSGLVCRRFDLIGGMTRTKKMAIPLKNIDFVAIKGIKAVFLPKAANKPGPVGV